VKKGWGEDFFNRLFCNRVGGVVMFTRKLKHGR
jgi:hypothetical protein